MGFSRTGMRMERRFQRCRTHQAAAMTAARLAINIVRPMIKMVLPCVWVMVDPHA